MEEETTTAIDNDKAPEAPPPEPPPEEQAGQEPDEDAVEDEVIVTIGEPAQQPPAEDERDPKLVNKLRKLLREEQRRTREYEAKLRSVQQPVEVRPPVLPPKPKLEDFDYDAERFEQAFDAWVEKKRAADEHAATLRKAEEENQNAWKSRLDNYAKAKASLRVRDYEDAEYTVANTLDVTQQGIIVSGADNAALVTYALGKDSAKLKELAAIKNPVRFAFAISKLETQLKTTPRKPPAPERPITGSAPGGDHVKRTLDQLREGVADGSVSMSKLIEFKKTHNLRG